MLENNCQPKILHPLKVSFKKENQIKSFYDTQKLKEFIIIRFTIKGVSSKRKPNPDDRWAETDRVRLPTHPRTHTVLLSNN